MLEVIKFSRDHLQCLSEFPEMVYLREHITDAHLEAWENSDWCFTGLWDNKVICCAGFHSWYPFAPEARAEAWAFVDRGARDAMRAVVSEMLEVLKAVPVRRVEAVVDDDFPRGHRLMQILGFKLETPDGMAGYRPDGTKAYLYSFVREV